MWQDETLDHTGYGFNGFGWIMELLYIEFRATLVVQMPWPTAALETYCDRVWRGWPREASFRLCHAVRGCVGVSPQPHPEPQDSPCSQCAWLSALRVGREGFEFLRESERETMPHRCGALMERPRCNPCVLEQSSSRCCLVDSLTGGNPRNDAAPAWCDCSLHAASAHSRESLSTPRQERPRPPACGSGAAPTSRACCKKSPARRDTEPEPSSARVWIDRTWGQLLCWIDTP